MILALTGTHGTGKTEVFKGLKQQFNDTYFFAEGVRHQMPNFGFNNPYELIDQYGIGIFEALNINSWAVIDSNVNSALIPGRNIVTDRCAIDNYAYYLALSDSETVSSEKPLIKSMAKYYASLIDKFVYFPIVSEIPLKGDAMRPADIEYQRTIDTKINEVFRELEIDSEKIYRLNAISITERIVEVSELLQTKH